MNRLLARLSVLAGAGVVIVAGAISIRRGEPTHLSPCAFAVTIPALWIAELFTGKLLAFRRFVLFLSGVPLALIYVAWSSHLLAAARDIPRRSWALLIAIAVLSVWCAIVSWPSGVHYYGLGLTRYMAAVAALALAGLAMVGLWTRWTPSFFGNFAFHTLLFAWLAWGAFPLLGELP
jgi:hypothetical protein